MAGGFEESQNDAAEFDFVAIMHVDMRKRGAGARTQVDFRSRTVGQFAMAAHEIGVQMGFNDVSDLQALLRRFVDIERHVTLRIDDDADAFRAQHV
jgi:hypothetical protein